MAANARRKITITYSGDVEGEQVIDAANNVASPATIQYITLVTGANTIVVPTGATAVTIVKPTDNALALTLKGVTGDTGVRLHDTDPDSIALSSTTASFVLTAGAGVALRLFWS